MVTFWSTLLTTSLIHIKVKRSCLIKCLVSNGEKYFHSSNSMSPHSSKRLSVNNFACEVASLEQLLAKGRSKSWRFGSSAFASSVQRYIPLTHSRNGLGLGPFLSEKDPASLPKRGSSALKLYILSTVFSWPWPSYVNRPLFIASFCS